MSSADLPLRSPVNSFPGRAVADWAAQGVRRTLFLGAALMIADLVTPHRLPGHLRGLLDAAPIVVGVLLVLRVVVEPLWRYRVHRWELTADAVYARTGWLVRHWHIVPISRIQTVDTSRRPEQALLKLATVHLRTASHVGSTVLQGLDDSVAQQLTANVAAIVSRSREDGT